MRMLTSPAKLTETLGAMTDYSNEKFIEYKEKLEALCPIDSDEKAKAYWRLFWEYHPGDPKKHKALEAKHL